MVLSRGDVVVVSAGKDYGKPRLALVVQADAFSNLLSVVVALMSSDQRESSRLFRIPINPTGSNGLRIPSDVMVDKLFTFPVGKIGQPIGKLSTGQMRSVTAALGILLGV